MQLREKKINNFLIFQIVDVLFLFFECALLQKNHERDEEGEIATKIECFV